MPDDVSKPRWVYRFDAFYMYLMEKLVERPFHG